MMNIRVSLIITTILMYWQILNWLKFYSLLKEFPEFTADKKLI